MREAKPLPSPTVRPPSREQVVPRRTGPATSIEGMSVQTGRVPTVRFDAGTRFHGAPVLAPSRAAGPIPYTSYEATTDYTQYPYSTFGKIFMIFDGEYFVCSGTSIVSDNKSLVWSAGHCVYDVRKGFVEDLIFVPAYKDGEAPFGVFPIYDAIVPPGWTDNGNWADDQAAIVVGPNEAGEFLNDAVGSLGLEWNVDPIDFTAIGYPGDPEPKYNGERMNACDSPYGGSTPEYYGGFSISIGCDMQHGASGGGWIGESGRITSVVSHGEPDSEVMWGPYFDDITGQMYEAAQAVGVSSEPQDPGIEPRPVEPPTVHEMVLSLKLSGHLVAKGRMTAKDGYKPCTVGAPVGIFRKMKAGWKLVKVTNTNQFGKYRFDLPDKGGRYATYSPEGNVDAANSCTEVGSFIWRYRK